MPAQDPNTAEWILAGMSVLTFAAAAVAGWYARKAALWTGKQAQSTADQAALARQALAESQSQTTAAVEAVDHQRAEAAHARRRAEEARHDSVMPTLSTWARPGGQGRSVVEVKDGGGVWQAIRARLPFTEGLRDDVAFRRMVTVYVRNVSTQMAKVSVVECATGEASLAPSAILVLEPGEESSFTWTHVIPAHELAGGLDDPELGRVGMTLWSRDNALTTYDVIKFNIGLPLFSRGEGAWVVVDVPSDAATRGSDWLGWPLAMRVYDQLDHETGRAKDQPA